MTVERHVQDGLFLILGFVLARGSGMTPSIAVVFRIRGQVAIAQNVVAGRSGVVIVAKKIVIASVVDGVDVVLGIGHCICCFCLMDVLGLVKLVQVGWKSWDFEAKLFCEEMGSPDAKQP
jgi:hypothetical protein